MLLRLFFLLALVGGLVLPTMTIAQTEAEYQLVENLKCAINASLSERVNTLIYQAQKRPEPATRARIDEAQKQKDEFVQILPGSKRTDKSDLSDLVKKGSDVFFVFWRYSRDLKAETEKVGSEFAACRDLLAERKK